jgi:4-alpha-glucanotransferase
LLHSYGIASEFIEFSGNVARIPLEHRLNILRVMGISVESPEHLDHLLGERESADFIRCIPRVIVLAEGEAVCALTLDITAEGVVPAGKIYWKVFLEGGGEVTGDCEPATLPLISSHDHGVRFFERRQLDLPPLPLGYHHAEFSDGQQVQETLLIVAPRATWQPDCLNKKVWGLSAQLYSLRSPDNWGMGDFNDLLQLLARAAEFKAAFVLVNPLHALDMRYPDNASPYSPNDRRYLNALYVAPALCAEFAAPAVQQRFTSNEFQLALERARAADNVDYKSVHMLKLDIFTHMYRAFCAGSACDGSTGAEVATDSGAARFRKFVGGGGTALHEFAGHQAELFTRDAGILGEPEFHLYLQWLAQEQLDACQRAALQSGMALGLIRDLAVGSSVDGCEVIGNPGLFCAHARIGAPPDNFNPDGQNWGLPPLLPEQLLNTRFAHFIALVHANMQSCGALRIDHVMSLMRLWWCPDDGSNASGAYVHYPVDAMFAILRLESVRNRCVVIGEDLGVVPPQIRRYLDEGKLYSNVLFYFEKYDGGAHFRKPEHYKEMALAMIANHDVPPLAAWWNGKDQLLRRAIGLITDDTKLRSEQDGRHGEKWHVLQWLDEQGLLPESWRDRDTNREFDPALRMAIVRACARASSRLVSLQLDDLAGCDMPVNIPGTSTEYPNWRRKIPVPLDSIFTNTDAQALLHALAEARPA